MLLLRQSVAVTEMSTATAVRRIVSRVPASQAFLAPAGLRQGCRPRGKEVPL